MCRKAAARGEDPGECPQDVEEVDQEFRLAEEPVTGRPGIIRVGGDRIVARILRREALPELRVGRIEAVDDLGHDLPLDWIEDRYLLAGPDALDTAQSGPAAQR